MESRPPRLDFTIFLILHVSKLQKLCHPDIQQNMHHKLTFYDFKTLRSPFITTHSFPKFPEFRVFSASPPIHFTLPPLLHCYVLLCKRLLVLMTFLLFPFKTKPQCLFFPRESFSPFHNFSTLLTNQCLNRLVPVSCSRLTRMPEGSTGNRDYCSSFT